MQTHRCHFSVFALSGFLLKTIIYEPSACPILEKVLMWVPQSGHSAAGKYKYPSAPHGRPHGRDSRDQRIGRPGVVRRDGRAGRTDATIPPGHFEKGSNGSEGFSDRHVCSCRVLSRGIGRLGSCWDTTVVDASTNANKNDDCFIFCGWGIS